jgi:DNA (cytosine-5)-methyltransferase 1
VAATCPNILSVCSGVGGLERGIRMVFPQARTVCYVEREVFSVACLAHEMAQGRLAPAPCWSDLASFDDVWKPLETPWSLSKRPRRCDS